MYSTQNYFFSYVSLAGRAYTVRIIISTFPVKEWRLREVEVSCEESQIHAVMSGILPPSESYFQLF